MGISMWGRLCLQEAYVKKGLGRSLRWGEYRWGMFECLGLVRHGGAVSAKN